MSVLIPTMIGKHHLKLDMPGEFSNKVLQKCLTTTLLPYETIVQATSGEPEAVGTVLQYYRRRIQCAARVNGRVDQDTEDYITQTLLTAIFKFRFGR